WKLEFIYQNASRLPKDPSVPHKIADRRSKSRPWPQRRTASRHCGVRNEYATSTLADDVLNVSGGTVERPLQQGCLGEGKAMKIVVIGGTGLIGSKTVAMLRQRGHEVVAGSPKSGINSLTGEGLKEAMAGAQVVIDLANSPSFEDRAVLEFFETSGRNLLAAETAASVQHHVALSIVG